MQRVVYGLFATRPVADVAIAELERRGLPDDVVRVDEFVGDMPDEELPGPATRSRSYALIGGGVAAVCGVVLGGLLGMLMFEGLFESGPLALAALFGLGAGLLGALVSGIAGAAIPRRKLEELKPHISAGSALVTVNVDGRRETETLATELRQLGAIRAGTL